MERLKTFVSKSLTASRRLVWTFCTDCWIPIRLPVLLVGTGPMPGLDVEANGRELKAATRF